MTTVPFLKIRLVSSITDEEKQQIINFIQNAVNYWCIHFPNEWFSMRVLEFGHNNSWEGTPLIVLYEKHIQMGKDHLSAYKCASQASGWLLCSVISSDERLFVTRNNIGRIRQYHLIEN